MRLIDADEIEYTMLYKENWLKGTGCEAQGVWKSYIDKMPTVGGLWIACSERLPEKNGRYLVTNSAWGAMEVDWNAWVDGEWLYPNTKPIAWMPLPEPYKEEK